MRTKGQSTRYPGIYSLNDGTYRIVAKATDPKTGKAKFKERLTKEFDQRLSLNEAVALRAQLINEIKAGTSRGDVPTEIPGWRRCADPRGSRSQQKMSQVKCAQRR